MGRRGRGGRKRTRTRRIYQSGLQRRSSSGSMRMGGTDDISGRTSYRMRINSSPPTTSGTVSAAVLVVAFVALLLLPPPGRDATSTPARTPPSSSERAANSSRVARPLLRFTEDRKSVGKA